MGIMDENASARTHRRERIGENAWRSSRIGGACALVGALAGGCAADVRRSDLALSESATEEPTVLDDRIIDPSDRDGLLVALLDEPHRTPETRIRVSVRTSHRLVHAVRGLRYLGTLSDWLDDWGSLVGITDRVHQLRRSEACRAGFECFEQVAADGLPVFGSYVQGRTNEGGELDLVLASVGLEVARPALLIAAGDALLVGRDSTGAVAEGSAEPGYAIVDGIAVPTWAVTYPASRVFVNAETGEVLGDISSLERLDAREIYRAVSGQLAVEDPVTHLWTNYPTIWRNTAPYTPAAPYSAPMPWPGSASLMHQYVGNVRDFFSLWGRDGWDDDPTSGLHRMRAAADVDYARGPLFLPGAVSPTWAGWWSPTITNGDQASAQFGTNAACMDVVAHEFFHGVQHDEIGTSGPLDPYSQRTAIWEGLSDSVGRFVERQYGPAPDWVVGTSGTCSGYRSMSDPEAPASPAGGSCSSCAFGSSHYSNFQRWDTGGGATGDAGTFGYANATIVDRATYLMGRDPSAGTATFAGRTITGIGNVNASFVVYDVVRN
jgi:hypothetical protein